MAVPKRHRRPVRASPARVYGPRTLPNCARLRPAAWVLFTFLTGTTFYLLRRVSGTLIFAMLLHALWDFSSFAGNTGLTGGLGPAIGLASVIVAIVLLRREGKSERVASGSGSLPAV